MPNTWIDKYTTDPEKRLDYAVARLAEAVRDAIGKKGRTYLRGRDFGIELDGLVAAFYRLDTLHRIPELNREKIEHEPGDCPACIDLDDAWLKRKR